MKKLSAEEQIEVLRKVVAIMNSCRNTANSCRNTVIEMEEQQTNAMNVIMHLDCIEHDSPNMTWLDKNYKKYVEDRK